MTHTYRLDHPHDGSLGEIKALAGGKAASLGVMLGRGLRLPVPPGFAVTTATCRTYLADGWPEELDGELRDRMSEVEVAGGGRLGGPRGALLVSVRGGGP